MTKIELFKELLKYKSITPNDDDIFKFISKYLGTQWEYIELNYNNVKNMFYYKKFNNKKTHLCFAGHIDVVPAGDNWDTDPFDPVEKDGIIYGRGTQDMKSGVAAFLYACKNAIFFDGTLSILLTSDEEGDATNGTIKVLEYLKDIDFLPDFALIAEPTCEKIFGDTIKIGRRGSINGFLTIKGKQGHAAYPSKSVNPIHQIAPLLSKIANKNLDNGDKFFAPSKLVITDIRAGMKVTNVTPNELELMFNVRNSTKTTQKDIKKLIDSNFKHLDYKFNMTQGSYPFVTNQDSRIISLLIDSIKSITSVTAICSTAGGTSDARFFGQFGIDTVEFGVINDTIHAINEHTTIDEVDKLTDIFKFLISTY